MIVGIIEEKRVKMSGSEIYQFIAMLLLINDCMALSINIKDTFHNILQRSRAYAVQSRIFYVRSKSECVISCRIDESCVMANFGIVDERYWICEFISVSSDVSQLSTTEHWQIISKLIYDYT